MDEENSSFSAKVYSPDMTEFELDGRTGLFSTLASVIVGPIRLVSRVMHNIMVLPATLLGSYAESLLFVSAIMAVIGVLDIVIYRRWPLLVAQLPCIFVALHFKKVAQKSVAISEEKHEVTIDNEAVSDLCYKIYDELDSKLGSSEESK